MFGNWIKLNSVETGNPEYTVNVKYILHYYASVVPVDGKPQKKTLVHLTNGSVLSVIETPAEIAKLIRNF